MSPPFITIDHNHVFVLLFDKVIDWNIKIIRKDYEFVDSFIVHSFLLLNLFFLVLDFPHKKSYTKEKYLNGEISNE